jgi:hypothetical protein
MKNIVKVVGFLVLILGLLQCTPKENKKGDVGLILTSKGVSEIKAELGKNSMLDHSLDLLKADVDADMALGIDVPVPIDPAGGYTHNRHKQNYITMYGAGIIWQLTGDKKYADFVKKMLLEYADLYPTIGLHPVKQSYARGKLFWQQLNDAVWMVYTSQAYDCVKDYLSVEEKYKVEEQLLVPYSDFLSLESTHVFNRVHNHGVWAAAAVGMAGYSMHNDELVQRALYGVKIDSVEDKKPKGFYAQLDLLFSPDGYYTEGPYYQRYALLPYMLFAQAINNNNPEFNIFEYRDQILKKAVLATLQMTNTDGKFFPFNDALKNMSYKAPELINAVDIIYSVFPENKELLSIASEQGKVVINAAGLKVAKDIEAGLTKPFMWLSQELRDGADGSQGAVGILRSNSGKDGACATMKYASQGMGHGHFDRLGIMLYDHGNEILSDYGAARYVNVEYKHGGRYLPENKTWAKQTVAHNTLVMDQASQFTGDLKESEEYAAEKWFFNSDNPHVTIMSGKEAHAYGSAKVQRTIAMIQDSALFSNPVIVDIINVDDNKTHSFDLPFYYKGQLIHTTADYVNYTTNREIMGKDFGYQHLWKEAQGKPADDAVQMVWINEGRFYTLTQEAHDKDEIYFTRIGASDPEFSLRNEPGFMFRRNNVASTCFASVLELHGYKDFNTELVYNQVGKVNSVKTLLNNSEYTIVEIKLKSDSSLILAIANAENAPSALHSTKVAGKQIEWKGPFSLIKN